ncbi:transcriptional regulator HexR [Aliidiomarina shirensis]|uniref:Transcriptional regulator HexR n=1 Tax=Aliidiomarina shirensis TaxID=1048642 RepID=A0A432WT23_9GAMM|nr:transcriptional regulator HexR [Aliidiomarina shirensis]RUO36888.1 transcriptional regulator HexR [Aliidiomarina shirensis]
MTLLEQLQLELAGLSKSERKVGEMILASPEATLHKSIAMLAKEADVSEPTVNRFCRTMGAKGYPDFKLQLAQSIARGTPYVNRHVEQNDSTQGLVEKIIESTMASLNITRASLDIAAMEKTIEALTRSHRISFFGLGASASVAHDAHNKFLRFATPVQFSDDVLMQKMAAINATKNDVMVFVSHTGRTKALCEVAAIARQSGATVIGITSTESPLAEECSLVLATHVPEDTDVYMPMASRIAQLVLVDVLVTGFTLKQGPELQEKLRLIKATLRDSRYEKRT